MRYFFYCFFLMLFVFYGISQPDMPTSKADSLLRVWNNEKLPDIARLRALDHYGGEGYFYTKPDSAFYWGQIIYNFAKEKGVKEFMARGLNIQGASSYIQGNYQLAIEYLSKSLQFWKAVNKKKGTAHALNNLGASYKQLGNYQEAIKYYTKSLKIREELGDKRVIAASLNNIGIIYKDLGAHEKALEYLNNGLAIRESLNDKKGIASSLNNIGTVYEKLSKHDEAMKFYSKSLEIRKTINDNRGIAGLLNNLGNVYMKRNKLNKAIDYFDQSLTIRKKMNDQRGIAGTHNNLGGTYFKKGDLKKGILYCKKSLELAKKIGSIKIARDASKTLWSEYKEMGSYDEALEMYELYINYRDSIESEKNQKAVIRQEYKYEYEKQKEADSIKAAEKRKVKQAKIDAQVAELEREQTQRYALYSGIGLLLIFGGFIFNRFRKTQQQKRVIEEQKKCVDEQKAVAEKQRDYAQQEHQKAEEQRELVQEKNTEILDSINYAKRLQNAILPSLAAIKQQFHQSFVFFQPKDIVSGDFYWMETTSTHTFIAVADCTGHGVPGAMVSVVCANALNKAVNEMGKTDPAEILNVTRELVIDTFAKTDSQVKDGMDISLLSVAHSGRAERDSDPHSHSVSHSVLQWAGANNPLWIIKNESDKVEEVKADKQPIGSYEDQQPFTSHEVRLDHGDTVYLFSDGFADQFGGEKGKKFKSGNFKKRLLSIQDESMEQQQLLIQQSFEEWKGSLEQLDDLCVMGIRI